MSYQIKSTPFFRRMVSTSKKNGQLQRLKEEYERIREFNDRTIEMKMRQVRLKRLFREIEEIKESSSQWKRRRMTADRLKTSEEIRLETLVKAKELGKEYSKMNALVDRCASRIDNVASGAAVGSISSRIELERKARSDRRISYGNDRSRMNIQKIATSPRKPPSKPLIQAEKDLNGLKEKLRNRLSFGNSCSYRNLNKKSKKETKQQKSNGDLSMCSLNDADFATLLDQDSQFEFACDAEGVELPVMVYPTETSVRYRNFADLFRNNIREKYSALGREMEAAAAAAAATANNKSEEDPRVRARQRWRKLALIVRHRFDTQRRRNLPLTFMNNTRSTEDSAEEYELRTIPNHTDLTISQINVKPTPRNSENDLVPGEVLLSIEPLDPLEMRPLPEPKSVTVLTQTNNTTASAATTDEINNPIDMRRRVQQYVKMFEPIVRDVARKEAYEVGVEKLRSIFEHQSVE